ncbi:MAG TPA: hypothetical protein VMT17_13080 [Anaeromyxobacteraceae bacterium]|nr:hypothetical protein [Anaeromyxobacteraceae bacterium]
MRALLESLLAALSPTHARIPALAVRAPCVRPSVPLARRQRPSARAALLLLALAAAGRTRGDEPEERFTGTARSADGALLYREDHVVRRSGGRLLDATTTYSDPAGRVIAVLRSDFSRDPFAPSYEFRDLRSGAVESVDILRDGVDLRSPSGARRIAAPEGPARLVTGQGLDRLVRDRLESLMRGEELEVAYAIPTRLDTYSFRVRALEDGAAQDRVRVRVEVSSWVLRLLAPHLEVDYQRSTKRLLRYRGVSNLADARGEYPEVEIVYAYPDDGGERHAAL